MSPYPSTQKWSRSKQNAADKPQPMPYLLFDAGGTLVFPDQSFLIQEAREHGIELTDRQLFNGYYQLIYRIDQEALKRVSFPRNPWPQGYAYALFETLGMANGATYAVARAAEARHRQKNLWTFTFDWIPETLFRLSTQGYHMSVISNSDGRTAEVFHDLGLAPYFERIFDSSLLEIEKPNPAIFECVLRELNLQPSDVLYIGDFFEVDVRGANRAGLGAVHLDPLGLYADWPGVHLPSVCHLPAWLAQYTATPWAFDVFPNSSLDCASMSISKARGSFVWRWLRTGLDLLTTASNGIWPLIPSSLEHVLKVSIQEIGGLAQAFSGARTTDLNPFGEKKSLLRSPRSEVGSSLDF